MGSDRDPAYVVAVDIGGTFTDCVILDAAGRVTLAKAYSTPPEFDGGILDAIGVAAGQLGVEAAGVLARTKLFLHSTTVGENALVDDNLGTAAILTTRGHEDTLRATRGGFGRWSGLTDDEKRNPIDTDKPEPLVPRSLIYGIGERTDSRGEVLREADPAEIERALRAAMDQGVDALAVCLLWSFANPRNEQVVREVARRVCPDLFLTLSHEVAPILGEYERTSTVALNARLGPVVRTYLATLRARLADAGFTGPLLVMQAYGGLLPLETAAERPVGMLESGPVSGIVGAAHVGRTLGLRNIIATDVGGTTFKAGVVREGAVEYQRESMVLRYHYSLPKTDVVSLGLAGGSIIHIDERTGLPAIGPQSAGSYPGPVCYDHGGESPTITDVDAILGYLNPAFFAGGDLAIDKARRVFTEKVAEPLEMSTLEAAAAIYGLANNLLFDLVHKATVQRGIDPRDYALFGFGGTAGMHVAAYGRELGADPIVIPHAASVQGAYGLVISDVVHEEQVTRPMSMPPDIDEVTGIFRDLERRVLDQLRFDGFSAADTALSFFLDLSYRRQVHVLTVPVDLEPSEAGCVVTIPALEEAIRRFEALYRDKYGAGAGYRDAGVEVESFRARGAGLLPKVDLQHEEASGKDPSAALVETREAWVDEHQRMEEMPGYTFERLRPGNEIQGPAIIWTPITTVVVNPSQRVEVDAQRNLVMWRTGPDGSAAADATTAQSIAGRR